MFQQQNILIVPRTKLSYLITYQTFFVTTSSQCLIKHRELYNPNKRRFVSDNGVTATFVLQCFNIVARPGAMQGSVCFAKAYDTLKTLSTNFSKAHDTLETVSTSFAKSLHFLAHKLQGLNFTKIFRIVRSFCEINPYKIRKWYKTDGN